MEDFKINCRDVEVHWGSKCRGSLAYSQLLIGHIMPKIISMKYLPPVSPKLVQKLKMFKIYWNLAHLIFRISLSQFWCQKLFLLNT